MVIMLFVQRELQSSYFLMNAFNLTMSGILVADFVHLGTLIEDSQKL